MNIGNIVARLSGVRKGGNGFMARCPAHEDKQQSLSIAEADGRILLNCFAGCNVNEIVACLGLQMHELFESPNRSVGAPISGAAKSDDGEKQIVAVYQYRDEAGELVYENVRFHPKDFRQRHFDGTGRAIWNLNGVRRVPYRLPQLLTCIRQGADVFLCEGEKDTDAIAALGLTATNLKNWSADFNRYIQGAHVIILTDHDRPGIRQAEQTARIVSDVAASVKIVDLFHDRPMPDKHGPDVSDFIRICKQDEDLANEEIAERICGMIERTGEWKAPVQKKKTNLFIVKKGNQWLEEAKNTPIPKMLLGKLWFEGELCILFADTNVGKSILAVQAADAISRGVSVGELVVQSKPQMVVYFDFELTKKQFEARFAEEVAGSEYFINHYDFHDNFMRAAINPESSDIDGFADFQSYLEHSLNETIGEEDAKVLIVDNLTYLRDETENAKNALALMKYLKSLKERYGLSILALAHTPKRDSARKLDVNDLQGSKMLINFCDSSFAIGKSVNDVNVRYIKQIKARNTELVFHTDNVLLGNVRKPSNFLRFEFFGTGRESELLKAATEDDMASRVDKAKELSGQGKTLIEIGKELGVSHTTAARYLKQ